MTNTARPDYDWKAEAVDETAAVIEYPELPHRLSATEFQAHIYDAGRCIFCNLQILDDYLDDPHPCVPRTEPHTFTSETGDPPVDWGLAPTPESVYEILREIEEAKGTS